jgi:transposase
MRPPGTSEQLEKRRRRAVQPLESSRTLAGVARQVGAAVSSVFRWRQACRRKGGRGLDAKPTPGRPPRLSAAQKQRLVRLLAAGPLPAGYRTDLWTLGRVAELIAGKFGVWSRRVAPTAATGAPSPVPGAKSDGSRHPRHPPTSAPPPPRSRRPAVGSRVPTLTSRGLYVPGRRSPTAMGALSPFHIGA